jgi:hypothetical protein
MTTTLNHAQAQHFMKLVAETSAWCTHQADANDPANSLRTLRPRPGPLMSRESQVCSVTWERRGQLREIGLGGQEPAKDLCGGRLLAFDADGTLSDGVANSESNGFFDDDNVPPYDTWVWFVYDEAYRRRMAGTETADRLPAFETYLVAWVPPVFVELADYGIAINPEACILWLDEMDTPFAQELRARGLFG